MKSLDDTPRDVKTLYQALKRYQITDMGPANEFDLSEAPTAARYTNAMQLLQKMLSKYPDKKRVFIWLCASHGMNEFGRQVVIINEFDPRTCFYKRLLVE